jgi:hypothetical protein
LNLLDVGEAAVTMKRDSTPLADPSLLTKFRARENLREFIDLDSFVAHTSTVPVDIMRVPPLPSSGRPRRRAEVVANQPPVESHCASYDRRLAWAP